MGAPRDDERPGALSVETVRRIAELAALELGDDEMERLAGELASILGHFEALRDADGAERFTAETAESTERLIAETADSAEVSEHPGGGSRLRPDEPPADALAEEPAESAPGWMDGFFTVPRLAAHGQEGSDAAGPAGSGDEADGEAPG